jgi:antitoxin PrlF
VKPGDRVRWRVEDGELSVEIIRQRYGAFDDFEPVDIGEETNAAEDHDIYGSL